MLKLIQLSIFEESDHSKRGAQIAVVEYQGMGQLKNGFPEVFKRPRKPGAQLIVRNVVPALRYAHRDSLYGLIGTCQSNKT